eukprot:m.77394 g.77394  ORF g.77394 m.77394 type:complete len:429 (+) comp14697_c0_seq1:310-1596(+)
MKTLLENVVLATTATTSSSSASAASSASTATASTAAAQQLAEARMAAGSSLVQRVLLTSTASKQPQPQPQQQSTQAARQQQPSSDVDDEVAAEEKSAAASPWSISAWLRHIALKTVQAGPVPSHIAFIMDGNRRFARKMHLETCEGHALGFERLKQTLHWCLDLGVKMVTVYAFSLENFKRSQAEVEGLMRLANEKFLKLLSKSELIQKHGVCVRVLGDVSLLPADLQVSISKAVHLSRNNTRAILNVCFAYTSHHEITEAARLIATGLQSGQLQQSDVSEELIERCLYTEDAPPPELLVRTSGEVRLSDFLLWQSAFSCLHFSEVLWPEFSFWDLLKCVLHFQRCAAALQESERKYKAQIRKAQDDEDIKHLSLPADATPDMAAAALHKVRTERQERVESFVGNVRRNRAEFFASRCAATAAVAVAQ